MARIGGTTTEITPWSFLVIFSVPDPFGGEQLSFIPAKAAQPLRAIRIAMGQAPKGWKLVRAITWPKGTKTVREAAQAWAARGRRKR